MVKILRGVIRGRTIELEEDAGIEEGCAVSIVVRPEPKMGPPGRRPAAGAMAEHWTEEDDLLLDEIERDRHETA